VRQLIGRVVSTVGEWGEAQGYFATPGDRAAFSDELTHLLLHQKASFNSPVWFNMGVEPKPQCSACFILSVDDTMDSILDWYRKEGIIFKGGSGSGVNLSRLRSSRERLGGGGTASGPVSFMRAADDCMHAALGGRPWSTRYVTNGAVAETRPARDLLRLIAEATWQCGDPGMQFDTTINDWHTCPNTGRINASNPCSEYMHLDD